MSPIDEEKGSKRPLGRREFLAGMGGLGVGIGLGGVSHWLPLAPPEVGPDWAPRAERFVSSTCTLCPSHCGIRGRLIDDVLVRIDGNPLHPVSRGGLCPKGRAGIQLLYHPARLTGPVERTGPPGSDEFQRISWEDALNRVSTTLAKLRDGGNADSVAWVTGDLPGIAGELVRKFSRAYGTRHVIREDYEDGAAEVMRLMQGIAAPPAFDLSSSDLVLSFGAALSEAWWGLPQAAGARGADTGRRPRWVQIDVRHSRTAAGSDEWLPIRPGTHGALAIGIAYILLKEGLYDAEVARDQIVGLDDWTDESGERRPGFRTLVLRNGRTEDVAERTGLPAERIVRLAKAFGAAERPVAVWDQGVSWRAGGLADALAVHALNVLIGALDRPGGVLVQPALPVTPVDDGAGDDGEPDAAGAWASRVAAGSPSWKALFLYYSNPVASAPNPSEVVAALDKVPLVVSFSPFLDETARHADLVLPDHTYLERWQDASAPGSVPYRVWGVVQPMVPPRHDTRATGDVILELASRLGGDLDGAFRASSVQELVQERARELAKASSGSVLLPALRREELRELEARGWWVPHGLSDNEFWEAVRESGGWFDPYYDYHDRSATSHFPRGEVRLFSAEARERIASTLPGLSEGFLPLVERPGADQPEEGDSLALVPYRVLTLASGGTALMPWLLEHLGVLTGDAWETWAEINPETCRHLGLVGGQRVRVESPAGSFEARLRVFAGAQPGALNVPYGLHMSVTGWGGETQGANPLTAIGARRDPTTGLPDWYSTRVRVTAA